MIRTAAQRACQTWASASLKAHSTLPTSHLAPLAPSLSKPMTTSPKPAEEERLRWRFPADDKMQGMLAQVEVGSRQTTVLTFNSTKPITYDLMEEALIHLYNKVESLRLCFRSWNGQPWVVDMPHRKLDFQLLPEGDPDEQHMSFRDSPFDVHDGPLWKARFQTSPEDAPCQIPGVKEAFPHQCNLMVSFHHAANDGGVTMMVTQLLISIIDSLLQGLPVDGRQAGELRDNTEAREEEARIRAALLNNPERLVASLRKHITGKHLPLFMEAFGLPKVTNSTTKNLPPIVLDNQLIERFANKCHSMGSTINAAFTALINTSMVEVVREAGMERDVYNISGRHPVDCRRLMKNCQKFPLGFHGLPFTQRTATPKNVKQHFWQYVKHLDTELRAKIKRNYMCEERALDAMMRPEGYSHTAQCAHQQLPSCDYVFSNLYSPRTDYSGNGKCVMLTSAANYMSFHDERYAVGVGLFSFRGQARIQLAYSTAAISREVAQRCLEKKLSLFNEISTELD